MPNPIHLFQAYGVELEYMIVDSQSLSVRALTDRVLYEVVGEFLSEIELGEIAWSNELALHVIELKTNGPVDTLAGLPALFQEHVVRINRLLQPLNARLMPTAMHPWMDPFAELQLWPHQYNPVYEAYNRIFDCRGHGWANLQSVHLNLPFADDNEFGRLHAAIRLIMPILPALAASSPVMESRLTGVADNRMQVYQGNSRRVPSITGKVIPEPVFTRKDYETQILERMYREIAPYDPDGELQFEWLNSRGAIARFDRNTIEIRVLDVQECPAADLAICNAISHVLQAMTAERWTSLKEQQSFASESLLDIFSQIVTDAEQTVIADEAYLGQFGIKQKQIAAGELWRHLVDAVVPAKAECRAPLEMILKHGTLSRRIADSLEGDMELLKPVYRELCDCLAEGRMFVSPRLAVK